MDVDFKSLLILEAIFYNFSYYLLMSCVSLNIFPVRKQEMSQLPFILRTVVPV